MAQNDKEAICQEYLGRLFKCFNEVAIRRALAFKPKATDVYIVSLFKSGTTLTQMIVHGLRSNGDLSFDDMDLVIPFMDVAYDLNIDLDEDIEWHPRAFKTHLNIKCMPKDVKCIGVMRDPFDIIFSWYNFVHKHYLDARCTIDDFIKHVIPMMSDVDVPLPSIWNALVSHYERRFDPMCLMLHYEDFLDDRMTCIKLIADFIDLKEAPSDALLEKVHHQSSFEFMKKNKSKFDLPTIKMYNNKLHNLDKYAGINTNNATVRTGKAGLGRRAMNPESIKLVEGLWQKYVQSTLGFTSYEEMRKSVNKDLGRNFN